MRLGCSSSLITEDYIKDNKQEYLTASQIKAIMTKVGYHTDGKLFTSNEVFFIPVEESIENLVYDFSEESNQDKYMVNIVNKFDQIYERGDQDNHIIVSEQFVKLINTEKPTNNYEHSIGIGKEKFIDIMFNISKHKLITSSFCNVFITSSFITMAEERKPMTLVVG